MKKRLLPSIADLIKIILTLFNRERILEELKKICLSGVHFDITRILQEQERILLKRGDFKGAKTKILDTTEMQKKVCPGFDPQSTVSSTYTRLKDAYYEAIGTELRLPIS